MEQKSCEYSQLDTEIPKDVGEKFTKEDEKAASDKKESVSYFQLFKYSTILDKIMIITAIIACLTSGIVFSLFSITLGTAMDGIVNYTFMLANSTNETDREAAKDIFMDKMTLFAISASSISFIVFASSYLATILFDYTAIKQTFKIREMYLSKVLNQDISWHDQNKTGDLSSRISDDLTKIQDGIGDKASVFLYQFSVPISSVSLAYVAKVSATLSKEESDAYGEAGSVAEETFSYIKTVVAYEGQEEQAKRYDKLILSAMRNNVRRFVFTGLGNAIMGFFMFVGSGLSLWYGARLVMKGRGSDGGYTVERVIAVFESIQTALLYIRATTPLMEVFGMAQGAAYKIFSVIESEIVINKFYNRGTSVNKIKGKITFEEVRFNYPARKEVDVLKGLNLTINPGETVALVGSSGCGKSTVVQLIQRFYDPKSGNIYIDDFNIKELNLINLRNQIGLVGQEPILFDESIAANIRWGNLNATQKDIEEAAKKANAHSFISLLPNGYQTLIGERGTQLSGGQKQRIAIARALVRKPSILLLDEATSALDSYSESVVQDALDAASNDYTTVVVAHRLSTVRKADRIVVIDSGSVVEEGSHDELMATKGAYHTLVAAQLSQTDENEQTEYSRPEDEKNVKKYEENLNKITDKIEKSTEKLNISSKAIWSLIKVHMPNKLYMVLGVVGSVFVAFSFMMFGILYGFSIGALSEVDEGTLSKKINIYCLICVVIGIGAALSGFLQSYLIGVVGERLTMNLRSAMFREILKQEMGWFDQSKNGVGSLGAMLSSEAANIQGALGLRICVIFNTIATLGVTIIIGMYLSWNLFLVSISLFPVILITAYAEQRILIKENIKQAETLQESTKLAVEAISNIRTVAALTIEKLIYGQFMKKLVDYKRIAIRNNHLRGLVYGSTRSMYPLSFVVTLYYGGTLLKNNDVNYLSVILITYLLVPSMWCMTNIMAFAPNFSKGFVSANQIYELLNQEQKMKTAPTTEKQVEGDIEYDQVSFSYPTRPEIEILKDLDLSVLKGKTVALVGPSGCGKSTIVQLLERFYDSNFGVISFGYQDITNIELSALRLRLGIVMQEPNLFSRTIGENIAFGNPTCEVSREEIIKVARNANIHNFIVTLPLGYDTLLGEKGTQLSGGQKQRIAIARALIRNPEVLLLDEATSALDAESEKVVQEALNSAREDRTCIVIAHRLNTIVDSDVIVVINEGKIAERGTHQELINKRGLYWNLHNSQN